MKKMELSNLQVTQSKLLNLSETNFFYKMGESRCKPTFAQASNPHAFIIFTDSFTLHLCEV